MNTLWETALGKTRGRANGDKVGCFGKDTVNCLARVLTSGFSVTASVVLFAFVILLLSFSALEL